MSFKDWKQQLASRLRGKGAQQQEEDRFSGSFSGYHPAGNRDMYDTSRMAAQQQEPQQAAYQPQQEMNGMMPEQGYAPQMQGYTWQQQAQQMNMPPVPQQTTWQPQQEMRQQTSSWQTAWQPRQEQPAPEAAGRQNQPRQDNISYLNVNFTGSDGRGYVGVERAVLLAGISDCNRVIEYMRNNESVILNMDNIADDKEVQRCLDFVSGAAFTLEYTVTKLSRSKRIYMLSPAVILVLTDAGMANWKTGADAQPLREQAEESRAWTEQPAYGDRRAAYEAPYAQQSYGNAQGYTARQSYEDMQQGYTMQQSYGQQGYTAQQPYYDMQQGYTAQQPYYQQGYTMQQPAYEQYAQPQMTFGQVAAVPPYSTGSVDVSGAAPRSAYDSDTRRGFYGTAQTQLAR
ncbi:MAG: cell division protein SepF [Clostridia bacterium]|nr:cell division protein SepF [Clostridia bacterium]